MVVPNLCSNRSGCVGGAWDDEYARRGLEEGNVVDYGVAEGCLRGKIFKDAGGDKACQAVTHDMWDGACPREPDDHVKSATARVHREHQW